MSEAQNGTRPVRDGAAEDTEKEPRINWSDPDVAAGNAPPLPRWPLAVAVILWLGWIGFLLSTALARVPSS